MKKEENIIEETGKIPDVKKKIVSSHEKLEHTKDHSEFSNNIEEIQEDLEHSQTEIEENQDEIEEKQEILAENQEEISVTQQKINSELEKVNQAIKDNKLDEKNIAPKMDKITDLKDNIKDFVSTTNDSLSDLKVVNLTKEKSTIFSKWWKNNQSNILPLVTAFISLFTLWYTLNKDQRLAYNTKLHEMLKNKPLVQLVNLYDKPKEVKIDTLLAKLDAKDMSNAHEIKNSKEKKTKNSKEKWGYYGYGSNGYSQKDSNGEEEVVPKVKTSGLIYKLKILNITDISTNFSWTDKEYLPYDLEEKFNKLDASHKPNFFTIAPEKGKETREVNLINPNIKKPLFIYFFDQTSNTWIKMEFKSVKTKDGYNWTHSGNIWKDNKNSWVDTKDE